MKKVFRATKKDQYVQPVELDPGRYTFHSTVKGEVYSFALKTENGVWLPFDLSWQLEDGEWSRITHTFDLTEKCVEFSLFASETDSEVLIGDPMFEEGNNRSTPSVSPLDLDEVSENISERVTVNFDVLDDRIKSRVLQEDFDALGSRVSTAESTITQQADEIELKVSKDGVVSSINQTPEAVKIDAEKIEFTGSVSFSSATKDVMEDDISDLHSAVQGAQEAADDAAAEAADALAEANTSKAITDKFGTTIDGGLINTVTVELRKADTQNVTAGHSGIQGPLKNLPAYWAGGTYEEAIAGTAKAIIRHDGTSKFTDTEIEGKITATSGAIGGFAISYGRIGVVQSGNNPTTDGMAIYNDFIKFSNSGASVFVGTNVLPATTGTTAMMRLTDGRSGWGYKYGAIIEVSGSNSVDGANNNIALDIIKGVTRGLRWAILALNLTSNRTFGRETELVCYLSASGRIVYLPSIPEIGELKIVTRVNNYNLTVNGNGKSILWGATSSTSAVSFGPSHDINVMTLAFRWDGTHWLTAGW